MEDTINIIPKLSCDLKISPFSDQDYLVHQTEYDYRVRVGELTKQIIELVNGERTIGDISKEFEKHHFVNLPWQKVHEILYNDLAKYGVIESDKEIKKADSSKYLNLRITLFTAEKVRLVSHLLGFLFEPKRFYIILLIQLIFIASTHVLFFSFNSFKTSIDEELAIYFFALNVTNLFLHELGHATACRRFGANHGGIGFGFYMFTPVLFADVSDAWKLKPSKRIIIDLAGFYMQSIVNTILLVLFYITSNPIYISTAFLFLVAMFLNLNPLFRRDGYWALSDLLNIPNLKAKSNQKLISFAKWIAQKNSRPINNNTDYFLLIYAVLDWSFIIFVVATIFLKNSHSVIYFPYDLYVFVKTLFGDSSIVDFDWIKQNLIQFILPFVFYHLLFRIVVLPFVKRIKNFKSLRHEI